MHRTTRRLHPAPLPPRPGRTHPDRDERARRGELRSGNAVIRHRHSPWWARRNRPRRRATGFPGPARRLPEPRTPDIGAATGTRRSGPRRRTRPAPRQRRPFTGREHQHSRGRHEYAVVELFLRRHREGHRDREREVQQPRAEGREAHPHTEEQPRAEHDLRGRGEDGGRGNETARQERGDLAGAVDEGGEVPPSPRTGPPPGPAARIGRRPRAGTAPPTAPPPAPAPIRTPTPGPAARAAPRET